MSQNVIFIANIFLKNYNADLKVMFYLVEISVPENFVRNLIGDETGVVLPDVDAVHHQVGNLALSFLQITRPAFKRKNSIQFSLQRTLTSHTLLDLLSQLLVYSQTKPLTLPPL